MNALASTSALGAGLATNSRRRTSSSRGRSHTLKPRAAANDDDEPRTLSFAPNNRSSRGYTAGDSAGQSNIFAVEPKTYVQGSENDTTDTGVAQRYVATGAFMTLVLVLLVAKFSGGPDYSYENAQPLAEYVKMFSAEQ